jgi:predicted O-methyltransferase YrrM
MDVLRCALIVIPGGIAFLCIVLLDLRRRRLFPVRIVLLPFLEILDLVPCPLTSCIAVSLAAYICAHIATTGVLPLHSPTLLVLILCSAVSPLLWSEGQRQLQFQRPIGLLFAEWMIFTGSSWMLTAVLFRNTEAHTLRSMIFAGLLLLAGAVLAFAVVSPFLKKYEGLRIVERVASNEQFSQPEYTPPTPECPQPELWSMLDSQTTEVEVLDFLKTLVTTIKPKLVVETGTFLGHGTIKLAEGIRENGFGKVITIESDPTIHSRAEARFQASGLKAWIESRLESSLETNIDGTIDLLYSDSHLQNREAEIRRLLPLLDPRGLLVIHDASSYFGVVREAALRLEQEGLISAVMLSTPRGVVVAQRREGRK